MAAVYLDPHLSMLDLYTPSHEELDPRSVDDEYLVLLQKIATQAAVPQADTGQLLTYGGRYTNSNLLMTHARDELTRTRTCVHQAFEETLLRCDDEVRARGTRLPWNMAFYEILQRLLALCSLPFLAISTGWTGGWRGYPFGADTLAVYLVDESLLTNAAEISELPTSAPEVSKDILYILEGKDSPRRKYSHLRVVVILRRVSQSMGPISYWQNSQLLRGQATGIPMERTFDLPRFLDFHYPGDWDLLGAEDEHMEGLTTLGHNRPAALIGPVPDGHRIVPPTREDDEVQMPPAQRPRLALETPEGNDI
jgi:hypothetical protein